MVYAGNYNNGESEVVAPARASSNRYFEDLLQLVAALVIPVGL
jgi:hypothetical protein